MYMSATLMCVERTANLACADIECFGHALNAKTVPGIYLCLMLAVGPPIIAVGLLRLATHDPNALECIATFHYTFLSVSLHHL